MSYDDFDSRKLSTESRRIVNRAILAGLTEILSDIDDVCFVSEVFRRKWTAVGSLRGQLRDFLNARLRCRIGKGGTLLICDLTQPMPEETGTGLWRKLGTNPMAACLGLEGSALRHQAMDERDMAFEMHLEQQA